MRRLFFLSLLLLFSSFAYSTQWNQEFFRQIYRRIPQEGKEQQVKSPEPMSKPAAAQILIHSMPVGTIPVAGYCFAIASLACMVMFAMKTGRMAGNKALAFFQKHELEKAVRENDYGKAAFLAKKISGLPAGADLTEAAGRISKDDEKLARQLVGLEWKQWGKIHKDRSENKKKTK